MPFMLDTDNSPAMHATYIFEDRFTCLAELGIGKLFGDGKALKHEETEDGAPVGIFIMFQLGLQ